jgi:UDP-N-acetylglucosamine 2-epimerase (non-hydrolysing)
MIKVITIIGTRPEIIKLSQIIKLFDKNFNHILVHTGQNYDYELNEIFFNELEVRKPDYFLSIDTSSLGKSLGEIISKTETILLKEKPEALLVLGDTNSSLSALIAKRMKIPVYHMEAGNRSFDSNIPEEINRKLVDHISDFNLVFTEHARRHLLSEGLNHRFIYLVGSPMREVLENSMEQIEKSEILNDLKLIKKNYFLVSIHREENVDNPNSLRSIINYLIELKKRYQFPIVVSTHPRTRDRIDKLNLIKDSKHELQFLKPFGFFDYNKLQINSFCTISDSGTISEESSILNFPAVTLRKSIERPEALDTGTISLTGSGLEDFLNNIKIATLIRKKELNTDREIPIDYQIRNVSERVLKLIAGTANLNSKWNNIDNFNRYNWN